MKPGQKLGRKSERRSYLTCRAFYLLLLYTVWVWSCELFDLLCYLAGLPQIFWLSGLLAAGLTTVIAKKIIGRVSYDTASATPVFWLGSAAIVLFFTYKAIQPDLSYDTYNYHLLCQMPGFVDQVSYNVMPGRFQMFGFRLGDRMFYLFRYLLGLRMGTVLNTAAMLVLYSQLTTLIGWLKRNWIAGKGNSRLLRLLTDPPLLAFLVICRVDLLIMSGSYMVELVALPFLFELIVLLLRDSGEAEISGNQDTGRNQEIDGNRDISREAVVFCLIGGLLFSLKMTNIVYLAPLLLLYLWKIRKAVTPRLFIRCLAVGAAPVCVYLVYNLMSTGNPIFPYFNTIFHSPYYYDHDFKDTRWGAHGIQDMILWPYYMIRYPDYRMAEIPCLYNWDLVIGYAAMAALFIASLRAALKRQAGEYRKELLLMAVYAVSLYGWSVTTGYTRYFMGGLLINSLFPLLLLFRVCGKAEAGRNSEASFPGEAFSGASISGASFLGAVVLLVFLGRVQYGFVSVYKGYEAAWRPPIKAVNQENARWLFRDHEVYPKELRERADLILLTQGDFGSYARLMGRDIPVWNLKALESEMGAFKERYLQALEGEMRDGLRVFDMFQQGEAAFNSYLEGLNHLGYYVEELNFPYHGLFGSLAFTFAKLIPADGRINEWYFCRDTEVPGWKTELTIEKEADYYELTALVGNPDSYVNPEPFQVTVLATDGTVTKTAAVFDAAPYGYEKEVAELDLTGLEGAVTLTFQTSSVAGDGVLVNPVLQSK